MNSNTKERNSWITIALLKPSQFSEKEIHSKIKKDKKNIPDDISWWSWKGGPPTRK